MGCPKIDPIAQRGRKHYTGVVSVPPVLLSGLYGSLAQYFVKAAEILLRVSGLKRFPLFAAAILMRCVFGISLRHILFAIVFNCL